MTLKKLLLGSSAVMFAAGAGISTAQAADPNPAGLVVTTMANYVEQCNNGNGWKKKDWCVTFAGSIAFSQQFGTTLDFGTDPWNAEVENVGPDADEGGHFPLGISTTYFTLTPTLNLTVSKPTDAGNLTLVYSLGTSGVSATSLSIGPWQFTGTSVRYRTSLGPATVTATIAEPGRLGWVDPRSSTSTATANVGHNRFSDEWAGPWPDFALDIALDVGAANITTGFNIGQRDTELADPFLPINEGPFDPFVTVGAYLQAAFSAGPADLTVRADFDRVNADDDGTADPVNAFGIMAEAEFGIGAITITPSVGWSHNYGYYGFKYDENERGNYFMAAVDAAVALGETLTFTTGVEYTRGPEAPLDAVLEITGGLRFEPAGASPVYVTLEGTYDRMLGGPGFDARALGVTLTVGAAF